MSTLDFDEIYGRFHGPILSYVRSKLGDEEAARELTQEVFLKVHRFRASYRDEYAVSTWLWTIARNTLSDHFRARGSAIELSLDEPVTLEERPGTERDAESRLLRLDDLRRAARRLR